MSSQKTYSVSFVTFESEVERYHHTTKAARVLKECKNRNIDSPTQGYPNSSLSLLSPRHKHKQKQARRAENENNYRVLDTATPSDIDFHQT
ncbi:hypothetical protein RRG08_065581 [Elysia crispata]|uniref:Uncharacterized protein n=1 Tax=Elysia crispata TaxID=231223 RepID=A0AAE0YMR6_9GAST|nr:hypothetical protein RRG08_065581 [Elysia crispata]